MRSKADIKSILSDTYKRSQLGLCKKTLEWVLFDEKPETPTREYLIKLFTFRPDDPYLMYLTLGHNRKYWLAAKPVLDGMIKEGIVRVVHKTRNSMLYKYEPKP